MSEGKRAGPLSAEAWWHVQAWHLQSEQQWLSTVHHQRKELDTGTLQKLAFGAQELNPAQPC